LYELASRNAKELVFNLDVDRWQDMSDQIDWRQKVTINLDKKSVPKDLVTVFGHGFEV
jgi:hypothetical protein